MSVAQILRDFSGWTSAHGIPHIGSAQNLFLRLFWTVIFLGSTGMFIYQMSLLVSKFLAYDVTVQTTLKFEQRNFPAVTVCNLNPYKMTKISNVEEMETLMKNYEEAVANRSETDDHDDVWGFAGLKDTMAIQSRAKELLMFIAAKHRNSSFMEPELLTHNITYSREDFIVNCAYNTKPCDVDRDFTMILDPIYGACFTFNYQEPVYKSTRAGPLYGLRILLKSNQSEYLPLIESAGVRVAVHGQGEEPFPDAFGYNAAAGFTTSFGIKFIQTERKSQPFGNCTWGQNEGQPYFYSGPYSIEGCFRSCYQANINKGCNCSDPRFASDNNKYCTTKEIDCVNSFASNEGNFKAAEQCFCPQPCKESTYGVTVSTALWPSDVYNPPECNEVTSSWKDADECSKWYGENTMLVEVYYERMNYQLLTESEAYGLVNLVSDMGGQLGLWMGISVITMVEFLSLLVLLCLYCMARQKNPPDDEDEDSDEFDNNSKKSKDRPPSYDELKKK